MDATLKKVTDATMEFGQSCPLASSFPSSIQAFAKNPDSFEETILATIRAGGDSAGRASMIGAWLGAHLGIEGVPQEWREKLSAHSRIHHGVETLIEKIAK
jgi:ADP-ribosylglycohydrolase